MKKINFNRQFPNLQSHSSLFACNPLACFQLSPGFFDYNQSLLPKINTQKHYQIKLTTLFINSGSLLARLLTPSAKKPGGSSLSNYISQTVFFANYPSLKKPAKIINQSGSNQVTITANYANWPTPSPIGGNRTYFFNARKCSWKKQYKSTRRQSSSNRKRSKRER